jgi:hypothetical protein
MGTFSGLPLLLEELQKREIRFDGERPSALGRERLD